MMRQITQLTLIGLLFSLVPHMAQSYIPRAETIIKKMTANNGRSDYKIVREVSLEADSKQVKARETWVVRSGDNMKVTVESLDANNPWRFSILYRKNDRQTLSSNKQLKTYPRSGEFFESLFHDRYYRSLMGRLVGHRFIPDWIKEAKPPTISEKGKTVMTPEPFIGLEPIEGSIAYALGAQRSSSGESAQTQLWVEQDSFLIKKGRLGTGAEFVNDKYQSYGAGLNLPGSQLVSWDDRVARIKLISVETTKVDSKKWALSPTDAGSIPTDPLIKEFYSRFR
jgi:hypothetical protein